MGINKQFRVTFEVTATMSNEQEQEFLKDLGKEVNCESVTVRFSPAIVRVTK